MKNSKLKIKGLALRSVATKGFTMIELLIVIAVLGILAVAVLSAINPIEQINRGKDTGSRSDAEQMLGGIERYYTANGFYPWQTGTTDIDDLATLWGAVAMAWVDDNSVAVLTKLSAGGTAEIKESFINRIRGATYNTLYKYNRGQVGDSTYICFLPKSANFKTESQTRCGTNCNGLPADLAAAGCANVCPGGTTGYYSCLP